MGDFTVGVEEEYQLVCPRSGELRSRARDVLRNDWTDEIREELQSTMLEVGTHVCASAAEVAREIRRLRFQVSAAAGAEDLQVVAAGLHPFSRWQGHRPTPGERYARLMERFGRILRTEHVFGMHIHVAVPPEHDRVRVMNRVMRYTPHLLALSCSSPLFEGEDTGFHSYRTILVRRLPNTGPPPRLGSEREFAALVDALVTSGAAADKGTLYWSIRPHAYYPTLEFRVTDACPRVEDAVAVAALARALVAAAVQHRLPEEDAGLPAGAHHELHATNEWLAARYGLDARLARPVSGGAVEEERAREEVQRLLDLVGPVAEELGDAAELSGVEVVLRRGTAADRLRAVRDDLAGPGEVVRWLAAESVLGTGLDRRERQREYGT
jgi:carboxylate-amine ligase